MDECNRGGDNMKFTYLIGTFTVTSALLLAGCSTNETAVKKEATTDQASNIEKEKNIELTKEEKIAELASPYNEIGKYFADWELPNEGRIPQTVEAYEKYEIDGYEPTEPYVFYTNGYGFVEKTGYIFTVVFLLRLEVLL